RVKPGAVKRVVVVVVGRGVVVVRAVGVIVGVTVGVVVVIAAGVTVVVAAIGIGLGPGGITNGFVGAGRVIGVFGVLPRAPILGSHVDGRHVPNDRLAHSRLSEPAEIVRAHLG